MRDSLRRSLEHTPAKGFERYAAGSIVLCNACALPIFKLDRAVVFGDKMGRAASAFKPLSVADMTDLLGREDIDAGVRATVRAMAPAGRIAHVAKLRELRSGDPAICPCCDQCFVQVVAEELNEVLDKSYTVELLTIPPAGLKSTPVRGRRVGGKYWIH